MNYVVHYCKNKKCNNAWLDKDLTHVKTFPPTWKYCKDCCKELGLDFDKQKPGDDISEEEKIRREKGKENLKH